MLNENMSLEEMFEAYSMSKKDGFKVAQELKNGGEKLVGIFCTYTPRELIYAAGAKSVSICASSDEAVSEGEKYLPKNLCPLIKASYGFAKNGKCPYFRHSDLIIGESTCDGKKKMYELLEELKPTHIMQLPHKNSQKSLELWQDEIEKLKVLLEEKFNIKITEKMLKEAIEIFNTERELMDEFQSFSKLNPPPLSGKELHQILYGNGFIFDKTEQINDLKLIINKLKFAQKNEQSKISKNAKRIIITGCPSGGIYEKIISPIEEANGVVVAFENCVGSKNFKNLINIDEEPLQAIAKRYLKIPCSIMSPNTNRINLIQNLANEYQANGVIDVILTACHTYNVETISLKKACNDIRIPYMSIETDYSKSDVGQLRTRIEAFLEMI